ncbi:uncharacterized protein HMPREF1120_02760 [Exophiala dermatitidis NIH/UT8656]|uniref:Uncharacterized protein n=1 Tax=Exophiala dermatitidis (strain ATCC 34100 / CBS 525.76 / NIH/UT8656) TaxID=858893 RepID=H6BQQ3_EXODN|nr:uncharacterized protein HMPREF1120_02760 [Exophiala dermatitidis NIH/UT8656]EHY54592.1 hypothetical protein HMPREF1120_02760 [Exophiala dermatitidis NIH/UT8656]
MRCRSSALSLTQSLNVPSSIRFRIPRVYIRAVCTGSWDCTDSFRSTTRHLGCFHRATPHLVNLAWEAVGSGYPRTLRMSQALPQLDYLELDILGHLALLRTYVKA